MHRLLNILFVDQIVKCEPVAPGSKDAFTSRQGIIKMGA